MFAALVPKNLTEPGVVRAITLIGVTERVDVFLLHAWEVFVQFGVKVFPVALAQG